MQRFLAQAFSRATASATTSTAATTTARSAFAKPSFIQLPTSTASKASFHTSQARNMKVAQVTSWGSAPVLSDAPDLPAPTGSQVQVKVVAVGVPRVVRGRALGVHSSSRGAPLPFDPTVDGIVQDEASGDLFYVSPNSAALFAERANVERHTLVRLAPGADAVSVATQVNPVASSWMALRVRTSDPDSVKGATVLVLGATSTSGRAAIAIARSLGAARIIGTSRSEERLAAVQDLDERVVLEAPYSLPPTLGPVHIILDFVGGKAASGVLTSAQIEPGKELQYIHVGDLAGEENIAVPGRLLNARPVRITGSGMGAWGKQEIKKEINGLLGAITKLPRPEDLLIAKFSDIESVWDTEEAQTKRLVLVW